VRIQVTDAGGLTYQTTKTITVSDVNEAPTAIELQNAVALQENVSDRVVVGNLSVTDPDTTDAFTTQTLSLEGADAASFAIENGQLVFKAGQTVDYEAQSSYSVSVVANAGTAQEYRQSFTVNVANSLDTLTLANNSLLLTDHDSQGLAVNSVLTGVVSGAPADRTLSYNLADSAAFLYRSNLQQLFDGNPATGTSPTLQFALQDTSAVTEGTHSLHLQLGMSNTRFAGLNVGLGLDVQVQLSRDAQGHLTMVLPTQTSNLTLSAGGQPGTRHAQPGQRSERHPQPEPQARRFAEQGGRQRAATGILAKRRPDGAGRWCRHGPARWPEPGRSGGTRTPDAVFAARAAEHDPDPPDATGSGRGHLACRFAAPAI
jgi:hypothetical protein